MMDRPLKLRRSKALWYEEAYRLKALGATAGEVAAMLGKPRDAVYRAWRRRNFEDRPRRIAMALVNRKLEKAIVEAYLMHPDCNAQGLAKIVEVDAEQVIKLLAAKGLPPATGLAYNSKGKY